MRQFIAPICLALQADGHEVIAACSRGIHWHELQEMGLTMHEIPIARSANPLQILRSAWAISRWLKAVNPDVLHVHTPIASLIGRLAAFLAKVPCVVYTVHGFYFHDRMPSWKYFVHYQVEHLFSLLTSHMIFVSSEDFLTAQRFWFIGRGRRHHITNGVDPSRFTREEFETPEFRRRFRDELKIPGDAVVVTIMGRLVREKGYLEFFKAAREIAQENEEAHFLAIGDTVASEHDDAKEEIMAMANVPELKGRVTFTGMRSDIPDLLAITDIFCLPSYREGMPVSVIEAMASRLPTVGTTIRGTRELIQDGANGFLVSPGDHQALAEKIRTLIDDPALRKAMGEDAFLSAAVNNDQEEQLDRYRHLFRELAEKGFR